MLAALSLAVFSTPGCEELPLPARPDISRIAQSRRAAFGPLVRSAACRHGVDPLLLDALVVQESRYNPAARSHAGAIGLGQLMPGTARMLGVNPYDPAQNLDGAARYLKRQLDEFGSVRLALAAYNAGPGRVRKRMAVPRIAETMNYVATIERDLARWGGSGIALPSSPAPAPITLLSTSYTTSAAESAVNSEGVEGAHVEGDTASPEPPKWDVFARFRWEREQELKAERNDNETDD